jgi:hypothetical protein
VRRYLWMAARSALRCNPAVRALDARVLAKPPQPKAVAIGHGLRKFLQLVLALWESGRPFDPDHSPWQAPAHGTAPEPVRSAADQAAGHKPDVQPAPPVVTAACADSAAEAAACGEGLFIDFAHLKSQLPLARVLDHLGLLEKLRGSGPQRRGACPLHRGDARGRTLAFIWALTEVSGVIAPRVIDTPLGMMPGGAKKNPVSS